MMLIYRIAQSGIRALAPLLQRGDSKLARHLAGRRRSHQVLTSWADQFRDPSRPLVWFHAPSVGEGRQAEAVLAALRSRAPDLQSVFTYISPSAEGLGREMNVDVAVYLPWDLVGPMSTVFDRLRPDLVVFTKTEIWPVMAEVCRDRGVPAVLVAGSVPESAGRRRWPARAVLRRAWAGLAGAYAITESDGDGLRALGADPGRIVVTGDPGVDSAIRRADVSSAEAPWLSLFAETDRPTWIAGSTWPEDEEVVLPAFQLVRERVPASRLILVPHEPTADRVEQLEACCSQTGWQVVRLSAAEEAGSIGSADVVVVDRVGPLATLYSVSDVAYVGGGFGGRGLHSVLEPAAAGRTVLFGPSHQDSSAALDLVETYGAKIAVNAHRLGDQVAVLFTDASLRAGSGQSARRYVDAHRGAADETARLLHALISSRRS